MARRKRSIAIFIVLANYVLALTVGAGLHRHPPRRCAHPSEDLASATSHPSAGCHHEHSPDDVACCDHQGADRSASAPGFCHGEKCPVCQFMAQKPAPEQPIEAVTCTGPLAEPVVAKPVRPAERVAGVHPIRGPPSVA